MNRATIIGDLLRRAALTPPDLLAADVANALHDAGGNHLVLYVVDYEQETLQPVALAGDLLAEGPKGVNIEGTMAGRSFQTQQVLSAESDDGWRVWAPVRERAERIGVLELGFPSRVDEDDDELLALCDDLGLLAGHLVHTAGPLHRPHRAAPPAPAHEPGRRDAVGHAHAAAGVLVAGAGHRRHPGAGLLRRRRRLRLLPQRRACSASPSSTPWATGCTPRWPAPSPWARFRYGRRRGLDLSVIAEQIDDAVIEHFHGEGFVTGHICQPRRGHRRVPVGQRRPSAAAADAGGEGGRRAGRASRACRFGLGIDITEIGDGPPPARRPGAVLLRRRGRGPAHGRRPVRRRAAHRRRRGVHRRQRPAVGGAAPPGPAACAQHRGGELEDDATLVFLEWQPGR